MNTIETIAELNRREFLRGSSAAALMAMMGGVAIRAEDPKPAVAADGSTNYKTVAAPLKFGVIGCGAWGREVLKTLGKLPNAPVLAICDTYPAYLKRASSSAPQAEKIDDYKQILANKEVQAVVVATPSHQHKVIVLDALAAGKHVYCEVPLAHSVEDARAIAKAAKDSFKLNFQSGLQSRADKQLINLLIFIRTGAMGTNVKVRSQWHKRQSWRLTASNPEREKESNWRLDKAISPGLAGELGIHQLDVGAWFLAGLPVAVSGAGSILAWADGRDVPDTAQAVLEYPKGVVQNFESTLANSFDSTYDIFYGTDSAILMRDRKAWMFKETTAPLLGWEVYAKKDTFYKEAGIVLGAGASKQTSLTTNTIDAVADETSALEYALSHFITNTNLILGGVEDFTASFDAKDTEAMKEYLAELDKKRVPAAGYKEGLEATVIALKANEAITQGQRIAFQKEWFEVA